MLFTEKVTHFSKVFSWEHLPLQKRRHYPLSLTYYSFTARRQSSLTRCCRIAFLWASDCQFAQISVGAAGINASRVEVWFGRLINAVTVKCAIDSFGASSGALDCGCIFYEQFIVLRAFVTTDCAELLFASASTRVHCKLRILCRAQWCDFFVSVTVKWPIFISVSV